MSSVEILRQRIAARNAARKQAEAELEQDDTAVATTEVAPNVADATDPLGEEAREEEHVVDDCVQEPATNDDITSPSTVDSEPEATRRDEASSSAEPSESSEMTDEFAQQDELGGVTACDGEVDACSSDASDPMTPQTFEPVRVAYAPEPEPFVDAEPMAAASSEPETDPDVQPAVPAPQTFEPVRIEYAPPALETATAAVSADQAPSTPSPAESIAASGSFVPDDVLRRLGSLSQQEADELPFGVIRVDDLGVVEIYNRNQSERGGVSVTSVVGKNFFTQVAPCCNNNLVYGRFKKGVARDELDTVFPYTFTYKMKPTAVQLRLYRCNASKTNWVFCTDA